MRTSCHREGLEQRTFNPLVEVIARATGPRQSRPLRSSPRRRGSSVLLSSSRPFCHPRACGDPASFQSSRGGRRPTCRSLFSSLQANAATHSLPHIRIIIDDINKLQISARRYSSRFHNAARLMSGVRKAVGEGEQASGLGLEN